MTDSPGFCTTCGQPRTPGLVFCTSCGAHLGGPEETAPAPPAPAPWDPSPDRSPCICETASSLPVRRAVAQVQQGLVDSAADGGRIGEQTWTALRNEYCGNPAYDMYR